MANAPATFENPRLANVSAALLLASVSETDDSEATRGRIEQLEGIFEDVLVVAGPGLEVPVGRAVRVEGSPGDSLRGIAAALESAREDRVLLLSSNFAPAPVDLLLALTAWPEHDIVAPRTEDDVAGLCALVRRREVLARSLAEIEAGRGDFAVLLADLDCSFIEGDDLSSLISSAD